MEKIKKPISIDFDAIDSDLQQIQEEQSLESSKKSVYKEKEKKPRVVKKKERVISAENKREIKEKENVISQNGTNPMENDSQIEIDNNRDEFGLNSANIVDLQDSINGKSIKKQTKAKENRGSNETQEYEIEFWKDQNASCYMTFKPGIERQIVKRVKNNMISYTIEYNPE